MAMQYLNLGCVSDVPWMDDSPPYHKSSTVQFALNGWIVGYPHDISQRRCLKYDIQKLTSNSNLHDAAFSM